MLGEAEVVHEGQLRRQMVIQAKKIEGNPRHPLNLGRICARGQAGPQILYNPDRIRTPLKLDGPRGSGAYKPVSWDEALAVLEDRLSPFGGGAAAPGLAAITGLTSPWRRDLVREFLAAAGSDRCFQPEPFGFPTLREANRLLYGVSELEAHDLENARFLISFGANLLESHTSPVRYNLGLAHFRQGRAGTRGKYVQVESRFSLSAANADEWLPVRPGNEAQVALAMAHIILKERLFDESSARSRIAGLDSFRTWVLENYPPERISEAADVPSQKIIRVAREFARHQPGFALAGESALAHRHGLFTALAVQSLNALVGNIGKPGGVILEAPQRRAGRDRAGVRRTYWAEDFVSAAADIKVLILWDADPMYDAPSAMNLEKAMERIPFTVAFAAFENDSTRYADLVLPDQVFLEAWDIAEPEVAGGARLLSIVQPVVKPMYQARDRADVLLGLAARVGGKVHASLPDPSFRDHLRRRFESTLKSHSAASEDVDSLWSGLVEQGVWIEENSDAKPVLANLAVVSEAEPQSPSSATDYIFHLLPFTTTAMGTGREANIPWLQELPDPMTSVVWGSWVEINPHTAAELGIKQDEWVWVESQSGKMRVPALINPAARPDTLCIPFGQGHSKYGRYASGRGANPWEVLSPLQVRGTGEAAWAATRVNVTKTGETARVIRLGHDREHQLKRAGS
jgi:anaerobic selenocysteine-containing dehydrogenase